MTQQTEIRPHELAHWIQLHDDLTEHPPSPASAGDPRLAQLREDMLRRFEATICHYCDVKMINGVPEVGSAALLDIARLVNDGVPPAWARAWVEAEAASSPAVQATDLEPRPARSSPLGWCTSLIPRLGVSVRL